MRKTSAKGWHEARRYRITKESGVETTGTKISQRKARAIFTESRIIYCKSRYKSLLLIKNSHPGDSRRRIVHAPGV